jgi:ABC-type transport system involved in cytochrome bd biosynthesis fused ATPase/permease subunit
MILTYPICFFVCRQVLHSLLHERTEEGELPDVRNVSYLRHMSYTMFIFISSVSIVMLTSNLGVVMSITGNIAGSTLGFILPALIGLSKPVQSAQMKQQQQQQQQQVQDSSNASLYEYMLKNDDHEIFHRGEKEEEDNEKHEISLKQSHKASNMGKYLLLMFGVVSFVLGIFTSLY